MPRQIVANVARSALGSDPKINSAIVAAVAVASLIFPGHFGNRSNLAALVHPCRATT